MESLGGIKQGFSKRRPFSKDETATKLGKKFYHVIGTSFTIIHSVYV